MILTDEPLITEAVDLTLPLPVMLSAAAQFAAAAYASPRLWQHCALAAGATHATTHHVVDRNGHLDAQVCMARSDEQIVLAYRGTPATSFDAWLRNLQTRRTPFCGGYAHSGMLAEWDALHPLVESTLKDWRDNNQRLLIVGHSKGGGLATLDTLYRGANEINAGLVLVTFGSPRVLSYSLARRLDMFFADFDRRSRHWRVVHDSDAVTLVPASLCGLRYIHAGNQVYLTENNRLLCMPNLSTRIRERIAGWRADAVRDHFMSEYLDSLHAIVGRECHRLDVEA